jgi:uncharacterized protein DUF5135
MTSTAEPVVRDPFSNGRTAATERRKFKPVTVFAAVGIFFTLLEAYVIIKWMTGPNFTPTPVGPSEVPMYMKVGLTSLTVIGIILWVFSIWKLLIQPWRREGHITLDGLFAICFVFIYWMDPFGDMVVPQFTYNAWLVNQGSWLNDTPFVVMANGHLIPEPYLLTGPLYLWCIFGVVVVANKLMKKAQNRFPQMGTFGLIGLTIGAFIIWDLFWELTFIRIGYWTYPTTPKLLTVFGDSWYRIHLSEPIFWGTTWALFACLRYVKNDKGQTLAERGIENVKGSTAKLTTLRYFALYGVISLAFLLGYVIPTNAVAINGDEWPKDTLRRSYFTNGICGDGTTYACPGQGTPIPREKSAHVDPDGSLVPGVIPQSPRVPFGP